MTEKQLKITIYTLFAIVLIAHTGAWKALLYKQQEWLNVPPAPTLTQANIQFLSDKQFAYRIYGLQIQNFGDTGGRTTAFKDYNYDHVIDWLRLEDNLDSKSSHIPFLAAYYFSSTQDLNQLRQIVEYLEYVGQRPYDEHWRWLVQAVFLSKTKLEDYQLAKQVADTLARVYRPEDMPAYALQMPAFIEADMGSKEAAYNILMSILKSSVSDLHPNEVNFMKDYICNRILEGEERTKHPLCQE